MDETAAVLIPEQVKAFKDLVVEYIDIFSTKNEPLGQTDVVKHDIKTEGKPIKCGFRRIPTGLKDEAIKEEDRMKSLGVIEPSESPWAAPAVLVGKGWIPSLLYRLRRLNQVHRRIVILCPTYRIVWIV